MKKTSIFFVLIVVSSLTMLSNWKVFQLNINQHLLLEAIMNDSYENFDVEYIERISGGYPNLSATAIPLKSITGAYWVNNDSILKALRHLHEGNKNNPFIGFSDMILANIYQSINEKDSFAYYTRSAIKKLPNAPAHNVLLSRLYVLENDLDSLQLLFKDVSSRVKDPEIWKIYLAAMVGNWKNIDTTEAKDYAKIAKDTWKGESISLLSDYVLYGEDKVKKAVELRDKAVDSFATNPKLSVKLMKEAISIIPDNVNYFENLVEMYFFQNNYNEVTAIHRILNDLNLRTLRFPIVEYIAISYLNTNNTRTGCLIVDVLRQNNYKYSDQIDLICR